MRQLHTTQNDPWVGVQGWVTDNAETG